MSKIRMRIVNCDFWCEDDKVVFYTLEEALESADEFLLDAEEAGMDYVKNDIEGVLKDGSTINYFLLRKMVMDERVARATAEAEFSQGVQYWP